MKEIGWQSQGHIVPATDDEPVIDVINRISLHADERVLIAIVDDQQEFGYRFVYVEAIKDKSKWWQFAARRERPLQLAPGASIGMLYDALEPAATFVPSDWTAELRFEKTAVAA